MNYTIHDFDSHIIRKYRKELTNYLENNDLSFDATYLRILNTINNNKKLSNFIKRLLKRSCYFILQDIYQTNIPPFILEYNLQFLESTKFNKEEEKNGVRAQIDFKEKEKIILLKYNSTGASKQYFKNKKLSYDQKEEWIFYEIYHEAKHLASIPIGGYNFYESVLPDLNEVITEIIGIPINQRKSSLGYGTLCARIFPAYYLLNEQEKTNVNEVFYGGKRTLIQNKPYLHTWVSSLSNYTHPFEAFRKILTEKDYQEYYNLKALEDGIDPFVYLYITSYYKKNYIIINFLNQATGSDQYTLVHRTPRICQVKFHNAPKSKLSNLKIYDLKRIYHPLPSHKLRKQKKRVKALEIKLQKSSIPFCTTLCTHLKDEIQKKTSNFNLYYYEKEKMIYQQQMYPTKKKIYAVKEQFQATHEYDENYHIKEKRL